MADNQPLIAVSDADLEDMRARLRATRWPTPTRLPSHFADVEGTPVHIKASV